MDEPTKLDGLEKAGECASEDFYSCEAAIRRLNEYLDHELTEADRITVLKHLEFCRPCMSRFTFEETLVISIRHKISHLCVPPNLKEKLHSLLRNDKP